MYTDITSNFLSEDELFQIEYEFRNRADTIIQVEQFGNTLSSTVGNEKLKTIEARSHYWYPGNSYRDSLNEFLNKKIQKKFGELIRSLDWHILNAYKPYTIHSDSFCLDDPIATKAPDGFDYALTFLIPLADYDTNTIVFNESSTNMKNPSKWISMNSSPIKDAISNQEYEKYLTHNKRELVKHFSINTIFPWKKGSLLSMSRHAFHCSDNFPSKKILEKRAIIGWSFIKI